MFIHSSGMLMCLYVLYAHIFTVSLFFLYFYSFSFLNVSSILKFPQVMQIFYTINCQSVNQRSVFVKVLFVIIHISGIPSSINYIRSLLLLQLHLLLVIVSTEFTLFRSSLNILVPAFPFIHRSRYIVFTSDKIPKTETLYDN